MRGRNGTNFFECWSQAVLQPAYGRVNAIRGCRDIVVAHESSTCMVAVPVTMQDANSSKALRIAYLGPPASFSHQAAIEAFPETPTTSATYYPFHAFKDVFSAIQNSSNDADEAFDFAVLPVENSTNGNVVQVVDLLIQCGLDPESCLFPDIEVVAEHYLSVHHCLYVHPSAIPAQATTNGATNTLQQGRLNITTLYTHPQVWGQCNNYLSANLPPSTTERIDMSSTSAAATFVAQNPPSSPASGFPGAICSRLAGEANKLALIAMNIEDEPGQNTTRFLIVHNTHRSTALPAHLTQPFSPSGAAVFHKSVLTFTTPHEQPGSLAMALAVFKSYGYNLTAITTRPSRQRSWHYVFFVENEIQAPKGQERIPVRNQDLLRDLGRVAERVCWVGSWVDRLDHSES